MKSYFFEYTIDFQVEKNCWQNQYLYITTNLTINYINKKENREIWSKTIIDNRNILLFYIYMI